MWEKTIFHGGGRDRSIEAVFEANSLSECRAAFHDVLRQRETGLKKFWKEPDYSITTSEYGSTVSRHKDGQKMQETIVYCLPSTLDPAHHPS